MNQAILHQIVAEFAQEPIPVPRPREFSVPEFPPGVRKAVVFVGMRRVGKTWAMLSHMHGLLARGVPLSRILYVNFEDERLMSFDVGDFQQLLEQFRVYWGESDDAGDLHLFLDEVHRIEGWEKFVTRMVDHSRAHVYISGSSARMLSSEIATELRGRTWQQEVFPLSFREYLSFRGVPTAVPVTTQERAAVQNHALRYLGYGGFPEVVDADARMHRLILQGYVGVVTYRDMIERHKISNPLPVRELINYSMQNAAAPMTVNRVYHRFKSMGIAVAKDSLYEYLDFLQDAYCVFSVPLFSSAYHTRRNSARKLYVADQGLVTAHSVDPRQDVSTRLENAVFCHLRRQTPDVFYYVSGAGEEVDFIAQDHLGRRTLVQVCVTMAAENTRARETGALDAAMKETGLTEGTIVTAGEAGDVVLKHGTAHCVPFWEWAMSPAERSGTMV